MSALPAVESKLEAFVSNLAALAEASSPALDKSNGTVLLSFLGAEASWSALLFILRSSTSALLLPLKSSLSAIKAVWSIWTGKKLALGTSYGDFEAVKCTLAGVEEVLVLVFK